jgi:hypothetical protein
MINFHNSLGQVDLALIRPEEVALLSPELQAALQAVVESVEARQNSQVKLLLTRERTRECQRLEGDAHAANALANPAPDRIEALRENIRAYSGLPAPEETKKGHAKTAHVGPAREFAKCQLATAEAQIDLQAAMNEARVADRQEGEAMAEFLKLNRPPTHEEIVRAMIERERLAKLANIAAGKNPDGSEKVAVVGDSTPITAAFAARRKGGFSRRRQTHKPMHPPLFPIK